MKFRLAANLSMLYPDLHFLQRFAAARADGFAGVEFLFPYAYSADEIAQQLASCQLTQVLFNAPAGGTTLAAMQSAWQQGLRGTLALPGEQAAFEAGIHMALHYAQALGCQRVHVMSGIMPANADRQALNALVVRRLQWAAQQAAQQGVHLLIEPINGRDMPGYFLQRQEDAHALVQAAGAANVQVQMDLYHCQIVQGDVTAQLRQYLPTGRVGHLQIASVPDRHEPDAGELHYPWIWQELQRLQWTGWIGCEYRPAGGAQPGATSQGLAWRTQLPPD